MKSRESQIPMARKHPSCRREFSFFFIPVAMAIGCSRMCTVSADPLAFHHPVLDNEPRHLQANAVVVDNDGNDNALREDGDTDGYPPCSLCQGVPIRDGLTTPFNPNTTCAEFVFPNMEYCRSQPPFHMTFEACCQPSIPMYQCEQNVHSRIFDSGDYNAAVPPIIGSGPDDKLVVNFGIQFQAIEEIQVEAGTATIFVTMTLTWKDPRLQWDVEDFDTCTNVVNVWTGHDVETATIWLPDFNLMTQIEGAQSMPSTQAVVYADGTVVWQLSGGLQAFCAFNGLAKIPFDVLGCQMLFGPYARTTTSMIRYRISDLDYVYYGLFDVKYNEWRAVPELGQIGYAFDETIIYYNVFFQRATKHYVNSIVYPTAVLTYLSFFTFLLDMRMGERLSFSMALALVVVAQQIVTSGMMPTSDQRLWLDFFVSRSFYWVLATVVESVLIGIIYFIREDRQEPDTTDTEEADEEELEPLATAAADEDKTKGDDEDKGEDHVVRANESVVGVTVSSSIEAKQKDKTKDGLFKKVLYKFPLRALDMLALVLCAITYTAFLTTMLSSVVTDSGLWLVNEPRWFDENSTFLDAENIYINGDPNN